MEQIIASVVIILVVIITIHCVYKDGFRKGTEEGRFQVLKEIALKSKIESERNEVNNQQHEFEKIQLKCIKGNK